MADLEPVKGLIELQDDFTSQLGLAEFALQGFSKTNQESLMAAAGVAGLAAAAIGAITYATIELGKRGSDINDVRASLEHFAGGAREAEDVVAGLREGTLGVVDDFTLAKQATQLLGAGVKLTADDFNTLGSAAGVLADRGLGSVEDQLKLVSDALTTGRTKSLSMALGVVENAKAEEDFAKGLGITADQLTESGKAEAHRIEVMRLLGAAVKDAGARERDFADELAYGQTQLGNWIDDLSASIAKSEVFKAGFKAIEEALSSAFSDEQGESISSITKLIEDGATSLVGFAQTAVVGLKVVEGAWNAVKTVVLGVETGVLALATVVVNAFGLITDAAAKLHIISPETAQGVREMGDYLNAMTESLDEETRAAAASVFGHTEFDDTLDKLANTLGKVKEKMIIAGEAQTAQTATVDIAAKNAKVLAATQDELNKKYIDQTKITKELDKSTADLAETWADYSAMVIANSGTTRDAQIADIQATFDKQVAALDKLDPLYKKKYDLYKEIAHESLKAIEIDWNSVKDKSQEGLQEMADQAKATYDAMLTSGLTFSHGALDEQKKKYEELQEEVRHYGSSVKDAVGQAAQSIQVLDKAWVTDADIAAQTLNKTTVMVRTLSGEVISLSEAQRRQQAGFSYSVGVVDQFEIDRTPGGADTLLKELSALTQSLGTMKANIKDARDQNKYMESLARYNALRDAYNLLISQSKTKAKATGFAEGGTVMVGEEGPEIVRIPIGSTVYPTGMMPIPTGAGGSQGITFQNTWNVNGTGAQVAREIMDIIMRQLKSARQFGSA